MRRNLIDRIRLWYRGTRVPPTPASEHVVFIEVHHYEQPPLAKALGIVGRFWLAHWQWIVGTALAILALLLAV